MAEVSDAYCISWYAVAVCTSEILQCKKVCLVLKEIESEGKRRQTFPLGSRRWRVAAVADEPAEPDERRSL